MGTAFQSLGVEPELGQHGAGGRDMVRLATMGGTGERDLGRAEAEALGSTALDNRQALQRLDRRARIDRVLDVASRADHSATRPDNCVGAMMAAFDKTAPDHRGERCLGGPRAVAARAWGAGRPAKYQTSDSDWTARQRPIAT